VFFWRKKPAITLLVRHPDFADKRIALRFAKSYKKSFGTARRAGKIGGLAVKADYDAGTSAARLSFHYKEGARLSVLDLARKSAAQIESFSSQVLDVPYSVEIKER
jgi:hypothetical protein